MIFKEKIQKREKNLKNIFKTGSLQGLVFKSSLR